MSVVLCVTVSVDGDISHMLSVSCVTVSVSGDISHMLSVSCVTVSVVASPRCLMCHLSHRVGCDDVSCVSRVTSSYVTLSHVSPTPLRCCVCRVSWGRWLSSLHSPGRSCAAASLCWPG